MRTERRFVAYQPRVRCLVARDKAVYFILRETKKKALLDRQTLRAFTDDAVAERLHVGH